VLIQAPSPRGYGYCCAPGPTEVGDEAIVSEEHIGNLKKARAQLIEQRRASVQVPLGGKAEVPGARSKRRD